MKTVKAILTLGFLLAFFLIAIGMCSPDKEERSSRSAPAHTLTFEDKIEDHFSAWDGSQRYLVRMVKDSMHDPKSFDHIETKFFPLSGDQFPANSYGLHMSFRGSNAFGAIVKNAVYAIANIATGEILSLEYEQ